MASRIREKPERLFEVFVEIAKPDGQDADVKDPFIIQQYPEDFSDKEALMMMPKFAFPCETDTSQVDHFTFVLTDIDSMFRFGYCRHAKGHQTCLCILSCLPWSEIFYKLLNQLAEITNAGDNSCVLDLLKVTHNHEVPLPHVPVTLVSREQMFSFVTPDTSVLPSIPASRNLSEYCNALTANNMILVFASMIMERRIYMTSRKLSRLTACIQAAQTLLYPMHWQHLFIPVLPSHLIDYISAPMPYIIGVHSNLLEKLKTNYVDVADAVKVDLDANTVETEFDDLGALPNDVSSHLRKSLKPDVVMNSSGDAIPKAFLAALVRLIGGYRDALKFREGEPITFDPEKFVLTRQSQKSQAFLEGMLCLQIFQQFIYGRLEVLNSGGGHTGLFEEQATLYTEKKRTQYSIKDNLSKSKKKGKEMFSGLKGKAAPSMLKAAKKLKSQGKKAMAKVKDWTDYSEEAPKGIQVSGGIVHSKEGGPPYKPQRPPPLKSQVRMSHSVIGNEGVGSDSNQLGRISQFNYHTADMTLINDTDIQAVISRSASAEMIHQQDWSDTSSESSSDSVDDSDSARIAFGSLHSDDSGLISPEQRSQDSQEDKLILPSNRNRPQLTAPLAPPRLNQASPRASPVALRKVEHPTPMPRTASLKKGKTQQEAPLIKFDSNEDCDIFDPLEQKVEGNAIMRNRNSSSKRSGNADDSLLESDQSLDTLGDLSGLDLSGPKTRTSSVSRGKPALPRQSTNDLMQEWSLTTLPKAPTLVLPSTMNKPGAFQFGPPSNFYMNTPQWGGRQMQSTGQPMHSTGQPMHSTMFRPNNQQAMPMTNNFPNTGSPRLSHPIPGNAGSRVSNSPFLTGGFTSVQSPQPAPVFNQRPMQSSMRSSPVPSLAGGSNSGSINRANTLGGNSQTGSTTGVNKAPDNLFSEFLPGFGDLSTTSAGNQAQNTQVAAASMQGAPQGAPHSSPKTQSWTTFD